MVMRLENCRALPDNEDGKVQDLIGAAKAHVRAKVAQSILVSTQQYGCQKIRMQGLAKNCFKINVLAAMTNLFVSPRQLLVAV
jgi:IS5 family transposase